MIRRLPIKWQARWWAFRCRHKIEAIKELRRTARIPLKEAKDLIDPLWRT